MEDMYAREFSAVESSDVQFFVRGHKTLCLRAKPFSTISELKSKLQIITGWPVEHQRLLQSSKRLQDDQTLFVAGVRSNATLELVGRLRGGKGGFGALLRAGARSSVNQNTDACRDLNGRRLRHVNADEKLKAWAAGTKERELEKIALQHIKDETRAAKLAAKAEVDVDEARSEHRQGMVTVHEAIREAMSALPGNSKRSSDSAAAAAGGTAPKRARVFADAVSSGSGGSSEDVSDGGDDVDEVSTEGLIISATAAASPVAAAVTKPSPRTTDLVEAGSGNSSDSAATGPEAGRPQDTASIEALGGSLSLPRAPPDSSTDEAASNAAADLAAKEPVVLGQYESASALQAVGMARLGVALSVHGLKGGGSLQQRADRLFLLRTTPLAELDRKHFSKPQKKSKKSGT